MFISRTNYNHMLEAARSEARHSMELRACNDKLRVDLTRADMAVKRLKQDVRSADAGFQGLTAKYNELVVEYKELRDNIDGYQFYNKTMTASRNALRVDGRRLREELHKARAENRDLNGVVKAMTAKIEAYKTDCNTLRERLHKSRTENTRLQAEVNLAHIANQLWSDAFKRKTAPTNAEANTALDELVEFLTEKANIAIGECPCDIELCRKRGLHNLVTELRRAIS